MSLPKVPTTSVNELMDAAEFRRRGREVIDYIADYLESSDKLPIPDVKPGYMKELVPKEAPVYGESWKDVFQDVDRVVMPGMTHWHNPHFHGFFTLGTSYAGILGSLLTDGIGCIGPTWAASPACTELEVAMVDWLGRMMNLPDQFLFSSHGNGGGVMLGTACEATLVSVLAARAAVIKAVKKANPNMEESAIHGKLVAYGSEIAHYSIEKAGRMGAVTMRLLPTDSKGAVRGETVQKAINEDKAKGLIPFYICAALGTTNVCAFDNLKEIGPICNKEGLWLHIDAAYAGSSFVCPEFRHWLDGVEYATTLVFNPHKWLLVSYDCSVMWVRDKNLISKPYEMSRAYMKTENLENMPEFRNWHIALSRPFRSLKVWFVLRLYGQTGIQEYIRKDVRLAHEFEEYVKSDSRFEVVTDVVLGLVVFRLKGPNDLTMKIMDDLNEDRRVYMTPAMFKGKFVLRFAIGWANNTSETVRHDWQVIQELASRTVPKPLFHGQL